MSLGRLHLVSKEGFSIEAFSTPDMEKVNTLVLRIFAPPTRYNEKFDIVSHMAKHMAKRLEEHYAVTFQHATKSIYKARGTHSTFTITLHNAGISQYSGYTPEMAGDIRSAAISAFFSQGMDIDLAKSTANGHLHPTELKKLIAEEDQADLQRRVASNARDERVIITKFQALRTLVDNILPEIKQQRPHFVNKLQSLMNDAYENIEKGIITPEITPTEQADAMRDFAADLRKLQNILSTPVMRGITYNHHLELDEIFISIKKVLRSHYEITLPYEGAQHTRR